MMVCKSFLFFFAHDSKPVTFVIYVYCHHDETVTKRSHASSKLVCVHHYEILGVLFCVQCLSVFLTPISF